MFCFHQNLLNSSMFLENNLFNKLKQLLSTPKPAQTERKVTKAWVKSVRVIKHQPNHARLPVALQTLPQGS